VAKGVGTWHSAGGAVNAAALPERPLVAVKAISIFYISEAVVL
jgi:hypothetical protein